MRRGLWKFKAQAKVDGVLATEATLICTARTIDPGAGVAGADNLDGAKPVLSAKAG